MKWIYKQTTLYFFALFGLILPNILLIFTENLSFCAGVTMICLPLGVYLLVLSCTRRIGKPILYLFPVIFLGAFQLVLLYLFKQGPIAVDMWLNLVTTNVLEVNELLRQLSIPISFVIILYIPIILLAIRAIKKKQDLDKLFRRKGFRIGLLSLIIGLLTGFVGYRYQNYHIDDSLFPLNACYNCYLAMQRSKASSHYHETSKDFRFEANTTHTDDESEIILFVIGETSRAQSWQLYGYQRPTNPMLSQESELLVFRDAMSQSNTTHKSVPILLSMATANDYDVLYSSKGIIAAYGEAGFHTCFFSNQMRNHSFIDFLGEEANEVVFVKDNLKNNPKDEILIPYIKEAIRQGHNRLFIVLHSYGSHFNYNDRYDTQNAYFKPDMINDASYKKRTEMINAYDNSIRYTDRFLASIIYELKQTNTRCALLYTSDHGEDIYDDKRMRFLHASPYPTFYQLNVPFIIWTSSEYAHAYPATWYNMTTHQEKAIGSDCVFHTLLDLGGIQTPYKDETLSLASEYFKENLRYYLNDHNEPRRLDYYLNDEDLEAMRKHHCKVEIVE